VAGAKTSKLRLDVKGTSSVINTEPSPPAIVGPVTTVVVVGVVEVVVVGGAVVVVVVDEVLGRMDDVVVEEGVVVGVGPATGLSWAQAARISIEAVIAVRALVLITSRVYGRAWPSYTYSTG
jgi:hypothetical protein